MSKSPVYGLVLSGGKSKRMGSDKALLQRDGESQLTFIAKLLEGHVDRVFVSTRKDQADEPERRRFDLVVDRYDDMGPLAGILSAMEEYPDADWLVVACDLPNISSDTLAELLTNRSSEHPFTAYISSHDGLPEPLCAFYRASSVQLIRQFADEGINCPRKILIRSDTHLLEQGDPASLDNVNTPRDLAESVLEVAS
ncbi:MAG: NTP transferase domain-containing protein [Gammaproteobacteria bacterium]|nr:NTP transferase domain-containing protein [Gammaproteobacteria bacterium]